MATNMVLRNEFIWEEEIPEIRRNVDIFRDRTFIVTVKQGKTIKFSTIFTYDHPGIYFKSKVLQGAEMMVKGQAGANLELKYTMGQTTGRSGVYRFDSLHSPTIHPNFDSIFCNGNIGKKVTYSMVTYFDVFKIKDEPNLEKCLKLPELLYFKKELSDFKLICESEIFECHKLVLSCQSDVFQAMFKSKSSKFLLIFFHLL